MARTTKPTFTKFNRLTQTWDLDIAKASVKFRETYCVNGVLRWKANDRVPPQDCLEDFQAIGCGFDLEGSGRVRESEQTAFLKDYAASELDRKPSAEERFEMRAAFGPGQNVVNVLTGRRTRT
jgi:hypothetical protein